MKIAQIAPLYEMVPPRLYGGTERIVAYLADALVDLGHQVTLFASGGSATKADLVATRDQALRLDPCALKSDLAAHLVQLDEVRKRAHEFDVLHFHVDMLHFALFDDIASHTLTTLHGRLDLPDLQPLFSRFSEHPLVSISDSQRLPLPDANWCATVQHGLPPNLYTFRAEPQDYFAFVGRISPEKRVDRAIKIAIACGTRLRIGAKVDAADQAYFEQHVRWLLAHPLVEFVGEIGQDEKSEFIGNARVAVPDRLARAVRAPDDRVARVRHAGDRVPLRLGARSAAARRDRLRGRQPGAGDRRRAAHRLHRPPALPALLREALHVGHDGQPLSRVVPRGDRRPALTGQCPGASALVTHKRGSHVTDKIRVGDQWYVSAKSARADENPHVLKHDETFVLFDRFGDVQVLGSGEQGLYHEDTRYLSHLELLIDGVRPMFLGSAVKEDNSVLMVELMNPDLPLNGVAKGSLHLFRAKLLWQGTCYEHLRLTNHGDETARLRITLQFDADFVDLFEVRGMERARRGERLATEVGDAEVLLGYRGLDGRTRRTRLGFEPTPTALTERQADFDLELARKQEQHVYLTAACEQGDARRPAPPRYDVAFRRNDDARRASLSDCSAIETSKPLVNRWLHRSVCDLAMLTTTLPSGPYPYAGVPWYSTTFGRDGIITAREYLWIDPSLARGVLAEMRERLREARRSGGVEAGGAAAELREAAGCVAPR